MSDPAQLLASQASLAGLIERSVVNFNKLAREKQTSSVVQSRMSTLREYWEKFQMQNAMLESIIGAEHEKRKDMYFVNEVFYATNDFYENARDYYAELLSKFNKPPVLPSSESVDRTFIGDDRGSSLRLPSINLPKFSGNLKDWENFRDLFVALVDSNAQLSDVQKLHYLKSSLTGEALLMLKHTTIKESNYRPTWQLINSRFNNTRAIVNAYLQSFIDIPKVRDNSVLSDLKNLRDQSVDIRTALLNLKRPLDECDDLFNFVLINKLDTKTRFEWETLIGSSTELPKFSDIDSFIDRKVRVLESIGGASNENVHNQNKSKIKQTDNTKNVQIHQVTTEEKKCFRCGGRHPLFRCYNFKRDSCLARRALAAKEKICFNCLKKGHMAPQCESHNVCSYCRQKHHSLLHLEKSSERINPVQKPEETEEQSDVSLNINHSFSGTNYVNILPTALVKLTSSNGRSIIVRALLDQGSQASCVTERVARVLNLEHRNISISLKGIGATSEEKAHKSVIVRVSPRDATEPEFALHALVLPTLTSYSCPQSTKLDKWSHLKNLLLADPNLHSNQPIDLLIGAGEFSLVILPGLRKGTHDAPIAQRTIFGWVISGSGKQSLGINYSCSVNHISTLPSLEDTLKKFWELEEIPHQEFPSEDEVECEKHFQSTHRRLDNGRYVISLPFKYGRPPAIGDTYQVANRCFIANEKRLLRTPELNQQYEEFMNEYVSLGHMIPSRFESHDPPNIYIPHLPVLRADSKTTKLRVVFNASCKSSNHRSLNDFLHVGPKLQADLFSLILRWRTHEYVYVADLAKMFRQILVEPADTQFQQILWRDDASKDLKAYQLMTVTYGTACAPFLANRVLAQLANDEGNKFPLAAPILRDNFYVDDVLFGSHDIDLIKRMRDQLQKLVMAGGFSLRKWASNYQDLLKDIPTENHGHAVEKTFTEDDKLKVLGITWFPGKDAFAFSYTTPTINVTSKRTFLSILAGVYDPLGWIAPFLITGKILMQRLWLYKLDWDQSLPADIAIDCKDFVLQLSQSRSILIDRWLYTSEDHAMVELHGFGDASNAAYAASVYLRVVTPRHGVKVMLVCAKTKVAPLKTITIPKLELCAAVLLCRTLNFARQSLNLPMIKIFCWSDSQTVLHWLRMSPSTLKCFVANRVSSVQTLLPECQWLHVPGSDNPADCASRGLSLDQLRQHTLWWHGPSWLSKPRDQWPKIELVPTSEVNEEIKPVKVHLNHIQEKDLDIISRFSKWKRLLRVTAFILRFAQNCRHSNLRNQCTDHVLSASEITAAELTLLRYVQSLSYFDEIAKLAKGDDLPPKSPILPLTPFLDQDGILCVGGRLANTSLPFQQKHPYIIPKGKLAELLVSHYHLSAAHGGVQVTLRIIRERYWLVSARSVARHVIYKCIVCTRFRGQYSRQLMGQLPSSRVNFTRAFAKVGIDYAGPLQVRLGSGRGRKAQKCYIALFVCMTVRAVHVEVVTDYSSAAFLAAFSRFAARRGLPDTVYSDNGTTFQGANKELNDNFRKILCDPSLKDVMSNDRVNWVFIPPNAPHHGGLWEAGIKSTKHHLRRVLGQSTPTLEELQTILCNIEAVLNSRPLTPASDDPSDYNALTPGHFLVGDVLKAIPTPSLLEANINYLTRWQRMRLMLENFWRMWSSDYFNALQQKTKWKITRENLRVDDLVLLLDRTLPPAKWALGRVIQTKPGKDNLVRVVVVRTANSTFERPVTQLCKLPVQRVEE